MDKGGLVSNHPSLGPLPNELSGGIAQVNLAMQFSNNTTYPNPHMNQGPHNFEYQLMQILWP